MSAVCTIQTQLLVERIPEAACGWTEGVVQLIDSGETMQNTRHRNQSTKFGFRLCRRCCKLQPRWHLPPIHRVTAEG